MTRILLALCFLASIAGPLRANFAVATSPPRFEMALKAGEKTRQVLEIMNSDTAPLTLLVRTADWSLTPDGAAQFYDELRPGSCRPWVAIERREVTVPARQTYRFRFEITAPADVPAGECRFAIMLEGKDATPVGNSPPITGRVGVIVYAAIAGAAPELRITSARMTQDAGEPAAVLNVVNAGNAHGRVQGFLNATDATGRVFEATPSNNPVLPGETRPVIVRFAARGAPAETKPVLPLVLRGKLEWGRGRTTEIEQRIE
jgi:hypothetical protein